MPAYKVKLLEFAAYKMALSHSLHTILDALYTHAVDRFIQCSMALRVKYASHSRSFALGTTASPPYQSILPLSSVLINALDYALHN
jgi:hypothetical protein